MTMLISDKFCFSKTTDRNRVGWRNRKTSHERNVPTELLLLLYGFINSIPNRYKQYCYGLSWSGFCCCLKNWNLQLVTWVSFWSSGDQNEFKVVALMLVNKCEEFTSEHANWNCICGWQEGSFWRSATRIDPNRHCRQPLHYLQLLTHFTKLTPLSQLLPYLHTSCPSWSATGIFTASPTKPLYINIYSFTEQRHNNLNIKINCL